MSIFSKAKSAAKKLASGVYKTVNKVGSTLAKAVSGKGKTASVGLSYSNYTPTQRTIVSKLTPSQKITSGGLTGSAKSVNTALSSGIGSPRTTSSSPNFRSGGLSRPTNSYGGESPVPTTLKAGESPLMASSLFSSLSSPSSSFGSISSGSLSGSPSVSLPSAPSYSNPGAVSAAGFNSEDKQYDPATGLLANVPQDLEAEAGLERKKNLKDLLGLMPQKESVEDSAEIRQQKALVRAREQEVNNYSNQLNSIVAKQQADLLNLREIGSKEGVTETVYGGQQLTINREAAIRALPVQAQLAGAQGNLELAQDYLTELRSIKQEQIDNDYNYNMAKFNAISSFLNREEKIKLDKITKNEDRAYAESRDNLDKQDAWSKYAIQNGQSNLVSQISRLNINSPTFRQDLGRITSRITDIDAIKKIASLSGGGGSAGSFEDQIADLKLSAAQKGDLVDIQTLGEQISTLENLAADGVLEGIGGLGIGSAKQLIFKAFGKGSAEGAEVRTTIGNIKGQIAKLRGGTSFTANEEKLLDSYVPGINESMASVLAKLKGLKTFIASKQNAIIRVGGGSVAPQSSNDPLNIR